ncbi:MAG: MarR family transcriptional regulator [Deltaproteobacteria bacterium]|nr:MarR family transcriptional regulator [Deltaproteobacteria bacterium]MBW1961007.1 MarR family transcriptional regulator [Deltaproteobacteria bacterium]MBW1992932.1 MarR family transcriptional regulator [Deltaproteobacteria bacterium]MBW2152774.1 MarR family transcriptional regulator [Deltaproteobacteria bacterium]
MKPENEAVIHELVKSVRKLVRAVYLDAQQMSKHFGLTGPQSAVLRLLFSQGAMSSAEISRQLYVTPSNVTGIIDRLEKKGLVERNRKDGDRRVALITLTEAGRQLSRTLPDPIEKKFISQLADLEPEHVQLLAVAMKQILNLIDIKGIEEVPLGD